MASGASFLGEASFPTASVTGGATVHGPLPTRSGSSRGRRGGRIHSGPRSSHDTQEQAWGTSVQRVALPGSGRGGACVGGGVYVRPGPGAGVATALHQNEHLQGGLSAEFCGRRSTRLVSKFHHGRQKLYLGKHSTEADAALQEVFSLPSSAGTGPLLNRWCHKLVGLEDFPYMLRELGNKGEWEKALKSFDWMVSQQSIRGEWSKLASIMISTLGRLGKVDLAQKVFDKAVAAGFGKNVYAFSALVSAYGRSGRCREALDVFQAMKKAGCPPNLITYNSIIDACGKGGVDLNKALEIFDEMQREGVEPDRITFNSLIAVCSRGSLWEESQRVFAEMQRRGIEQDIFTYNTLVDAVCKGGQMDIAASIVATMRQKGIMPNVVTYSTMIDGYGKIGCFDEAIRVYHEMKDAGIRPDRVSYNTLLDIYAKLGMFEEALTICKEMERAGWKTDVVTYNALIDAYGKQGKYREAASLFSRMKDEGLVPNVLTYSALIYAFSKGGLHQEARQVFEEFRDAGLKPDVVLYSALIDAFCKSGLVEEAVQLLEEMMAEGIQPNIVTYNSLIDAYGRRGQVDYALSTMERMKGVGIVPDCRTYNSVIYAFGNDCRGEQPLQTPEQVRARSVEFDIPPVPRPLDAQGGQGDILAAVRVFHEMQELGVKPNVVTFSAILNACSRCASFEEASLLLEEMRLFDSRVYGVAHGLLMGMREQVWQEAEALFDQMFFMDLATAGAFYNALTDVLWHFGQREGAQKVVIAAKRRQVWANAWWRSEQQFCLDLHLMSVGAAQAMLHVWLLHIRGLLYEGHELPRLLSILTGWGKHSKVAGDSSVKRAVEAHLVDIGAPFHVARHNEGRLVSAGHVVGAWLREGRTEQLLRLRDQVCRVNNRRDSMSDPRLILATR